MTSRQVGRRISTVSARRKTRDARQRGGARRAAGGRQEPMSKKETWRLIQLVACGSIFVLLVAVKLLLPGKMAHLNSKLSAMMEQNIDVQAVFSAVGRAVSGEDDNALEDVYQAVFQPEEAEEGAVETAAPAGGEAAPIETPDTLQLLREFRTGAGTSDSWLDLPPVSEKATAEEVQQTEGIGTSGGEASTLAYVLYSDQNLPENVCLEQSLLGFDYCTPVMGTLTSGFGYREHPVEGEERFHYGIDLAANTGTAIGCFADGTVTAVGESSSYGKYITVTHEGGYSTLYAHCSKIVASSGDTVKEGQTIAEVGETGIATGPHLHFELHQGSQYLNPIYYVSLV